MKSYFLLPILSLAALSFAAAQRRAGPPASYPPYADPGSTPGLIFVIVVSAAFITGFVGTCILHCFYGDTIDDGANEIALHAAAASRRGRLSPSGLDPAVINSFPVFKYSEIIKHLKISQGEVLLCAVCVSEFEDEETLRLLPECEHVFHPECIDLWLASQSTCPICRANLSRGTESTREWNNNSRPEVGEAPNDQNQVSITVDGNQRIFPRPHSTGHSLVRLGDERYTSDKWFCTTPPFPTGKVGVVDGDVTAVPVRTSKSSSNLNSEFGMYIPIL